MFEGVRVRVLGLEGTSSWCLMGLKMEENSELEEGEACYYMDDDENINPDIDLSYIVRMYFCFCLKLWFVC